MGKRFGKTGLCASQHGVLGWGFSIVSHEHEDRLPCVGARLWGGMERYYAVMGFSIKLSEREMIHPTRASIFSPMDFASWHFLCEEQTL